VQLDIIKQTPEDMIVKNVVKGNTQAMKDKPDVTKL